VFAVNVNIMMKTNYKKLLPLIVAFAFLCQKIDSASGEDYLGVKSIFNIEVDPYFTLDSKLIFVALDVSVDTLGHIGQTIQIMRWISKSCPNVDQELVVEACHVTFYNRYFGIRFDELNLSPKAEEAAKEVLGYYPVERPPKYYDQHDVLKIEELYGRDILGEIVLAWSRKVEERYGLKVTVIFTSQSDDIGENSEYFGELISAGHVVFFGYYYRSKYRQVEKLRQNGVNTYYIATAAFVEYIANASSKKMFNAVFHLGTAHAGRRYDVIPLGLHTDIDLMSTRGASTQKELRGEIMDHCEGNRNSSLKDYLAFPWMFIYSCEATTMQIYFRSLAASRKVGDTTSVVWHLRHPKYTAPHVVDYGTFMMYHAGLMGRLPFYEDGVLKMMVAENDEIGVTNESGTITLKAVCRDLKRQKYYLIRRREGIFFHLYERVYLKLISDDIYRIDDPDCRMEERIRVNTTDLEFIIIDTPIASREFKYLLQQGAAERHGECGVNLLSGAISFSEALSINSPSLMSGYPHDYEWFKALIWVLKKYAEKEEVSDLAKFEAIQKKYFDIDRLKAYGKTSECIIGNLDEYKRVFNTAHRIYLRALLDTGNNPCKVLLDRIKRNPCRKLDPSVDSVKHKIQSSSSGRSV